MHKGTINRVILDRGFGFICCDGADVFFHMSDLADSLEFTEQLTELHVAFDIIDTDKGPRAQNVRPV